MFNEMFLDHSYKNQTNTSTIKYAHQAVLLCTIPSFSMYFNMQTLLASMLLFKLKDPTS